jgi:hypothetical protein
MWFENLCHDYWIIFRENWLSVKMLIYKEDFEIVGEFLVSWKFDFWVVK